MLNLKSLLNIGSDLKWNLNKIKLFSNMLNIKYILEECFTLVHIISRLHISLGI